MPDQLEIPSTIVGKPGTVLILPPRLSKVGRSAGGVEFGVDPWKVNPNSFRNRERRIRVRRRDAVNVTLLSRGDKKQVVRDRHPGPVDRHQKVARGQAMAGAHQVIGAKNHLIIVVARGGRAEPVLIVCRR